MKCRVGNVSVSLGAVQADHLGIGLKIYLALHLERPPSSVGESRLSRSSPSVCSCTRRPPARTVRQVSPPGWPWSPYYSTWRMNRSPDWALHGVHHCCSVTSSRLHRPQSAHFVVHYEIKWAHSAYTSSFDNYFAPSIGFPPPDDSGESLAGCCEFCDIIFDYEIFLI
jgi:hypothetical protein